jgi:ATP-dependent DNA helicase RecG
LNLDKKEQTSIIKNMDLTTPIKDAGKIFKMYASRLEKLGIVTFEDFLYHIPSRYEDFSVISKINQLQEGEIVTIQGKVDEIKNVFTKNHKKIQQAKVSDDTGTIDIMWFNQIYLTKTIHKGDSISLAGRVEKKNNHFTLYSPEYEMLYPDKMTLHTGRLVPVYPETKGVSSKWLRRQVFKIIHESIVSKKEHLPDSIIKQYTLLEIQTSIEQIHFPTSLEHVQKAKQRLAFDEIFFLQLASNLRRKEWSKKKTGYSFAIDSYQKDINRFWEQLPFTLTHAQQKAISDIFSDIAKMQPMNRLLQGDVGSGKTVVAAISMYLSFLNGFQSVLAAPTEILAEQHFATIKKILEPLGVKVSLVTGSKKMKTNDFDILVGTHAVFSDNIIFENLGFIAIDEQQRFGVAQRAGLRQKGTNPHVLTMTATPLPRTVALTMYGDLDLSVLDEMPKGRKKIKTWLVPNQKREAGYEWIQKQIGEHGDQAFIVCPFIEESESMTTVKAAAKEYETLQKDVFPHLKLGLLHGKMKPKEKDAVLQDFRDKKVDILVATPVVEVGIDIPNATIIVIEAAERFGLAQLHQLRGRVGRGDKQSYCLLFTESQSPQTRNRLSAMETTYMGSELAELDLKLRGPGEIYGTLQSGQSMLKIASFSDFPLIEKAKKAAEQIFPELEKHPLLLEKLQEVQIKQVSPD